MSSASWLATALDQEMLEVVRSPSVAIAPRATPDSALPSKTGSDVARELGGRYLLRYVLDDQVGEYLAGSTAPHWTTPTPYSATDTVSWLALPAPTLIRRYVMMLDPARIPQLLGPRWIRFGKGIEYLLPSGFPANAVVFPWELEIT